MILGWLFVRPIPLPTPDGVNTLEDAPYPASSSTRRAYFERSDDSSMRLLPDNEPDHDETYVQSPKQHARTVSITGCGAVGVGVLSENEPPDVHGKELFMSPKFWLLFSITSLRESPNRCRINWVLTPPSERRRSDV